MPEADLLAEVCGIFEGASEGRHDEPLARQAATLCRLAVADDALIPQWPPKGGDERRPHASRLKTASPHNRMRRISIAVTPARHE